MNITIYQDRCIRCGKCEADCPSGAVVHDGEEDTYSVDQSCCIGCSHCALVCPVDAVETDHGPLPEWRDPGPSAVQVRSFLVGKRSVRIYARSRCPGTRLTTSSRWAPSPPPPPTPRTGGRSC